MKRFGVFCSALFAVFLSASSFAAPGPADDSRRARNFEVLREVISTLEQNYYSDDFRKRNASKITAAEKNIAAAPDDFALTELINRLLASFGDSHQNLMPPPSRESARAMEQASGTPHGGRLGLALGEADGNVFLLRVEKNSPAERAGLRPGFTVAEVNGCAITPEKTAACGWAAIADSLLRCAPEDGLVKLKTGDGKTFSVAPEGSVEYFQVGAMPSLPLSYFSTFLAGGKVGYLAFNAFTPEIVGRVRRSVEGEFASCESLILDLRGNVGGLIFLCENLAGWVSPREISFGSIVLQNVPIEPLSYPQKRGFKGRLAVLIDRNSYSTAEAFAAGIQDAKAGIVVGSRSAGMCLPSSFLSLKCGFLLQTVMGDFRRANGGALERVGVTPDVGPLPEKPGPWRDRTLDAALEALGYPPR